MNRIFLFQDELVDGQYIIRDELRIKHIRNVLSAGPGDILKGVIIGIGLINIKIDELTDNVVKFSSIEKVSGKISWYNLIVGSCRPQTCKKIFEHGTSLGLSKINFFKAANSEKSYLQSKVFTEKEYIRMQILGLSQSNCYYQLPEVSCENYFSIDHYSKFNQKLILSLNSSKWIDEVTLDLNKDVSLVVGPERGFLDFEEEAFIKQGAVPVKVSNSTLRVEIAIFTAIGQLEMLRKNRI